MKQSVFKTAISGFFWTSAQNAGSQLSALVVFIILARVLQPVDFGLVALAHVCIAFLSLFTGTSITSALVQRPEIDDEHLDTMFWLLFALSTALALLVWWLAPNIAMFLDEPRVQPIVRWLAVCLVLNALQQVQASILRRKLKFKTLALRSLISVPIAGVVGITLALMGFGVWSLVARMIVSAGIRTIVMWYTSDWRPRLVFSTTHLRDLWSFGMNVTGANFLSFSGRHLDTFLIGYTLGAGQLGYYTVAKRIVVLMTELIGGTIGRVAWPIFSRIQSDSAKVLNTFHRAIQYVSLLSFPVFTGIALLADSIVPVVFGARWIQSARLMQVLALVGLVQTVLRFHETLLVGMGRADFKFRLQALLTAANLLAFFVAFQYGLVAVTIGFAVVAVLLAPLWVVSVRAVVDLKFKQYLRDYAPATVAVVAMATALLAMRYIIDFGPPTVGNLVLQVGVGVVSYSLVSLVVNKNLVPDVIKVAKIRREKKV